MIATLLWKGEKIAQCGSVEGLLNLFNDGLEDDSSTDPSTIDAIVTEAAGELERIGSFGYGYYLLKVTDGGRE